MMENILQYLVQINWKALILIGLAGGLLATSISILGDLLIDFYHSNWIKIKRKFLKFKQRLPKFTIYVLT